MPIIIKISLEHGDETLGSCYTHEVGLRRLETNYSLAMLKVFFIELN